MINNKSSAITYRKPKHAKSLKWDNYPKIYVNESPQHFIWHLIDDIQRLIWSEENIINISLNNTNNSNIGYDEYCLNHKHNLPTLDFVCG